MFISQFKPSINDFKNKFALKSVQDKLTDIQVRMG